MDDPQSIPETTSLYVILVVIRKFKIQYLSNIFGNSTLTGKDSGNSHLMSTSKFKIMITGNEEKTSINKEKDEEESTNKENDEEETAEYIEAQIERAEGAMSWYPPHPLSRADTKYYEDRAPSNIIPLIMFVNTFNESYLKISECFNLMRMKLDMLFVQGISSLILEYSNYEIIVDELFQLEKSNDFPYLKLTRTKVPNHGIEIVERKYGYQLFGVNVGLHIEYDMDSRLFLTKIVKYDLNGLLQDLAFELGSQGGGCTGSAPDYKVGCYSNNKRLSGWKAYSPILIKSQETCISLVTRIYTTSIKKWDPKEWLCVAELQNFSTLIPRNNIPFEICEYDWLSERSTLSKYRSEQSTHSKYRCVIQ